MSLLLVRLAGVDLTTEGRVWLQKNMAPTQTVWLKLISRDDDILHCLVCQSRVSHQMNEIKKGTSWDNRVNLLYLLERLLVHMTKALLCLPSCLHQGSMWSYSVNEEVLRLGLARTAPIVGLLPDSQLYWRLHKRLHRAEVRAERSERGLWKQDSLWERISKTVRDSALFRLMRRIFQRT